MQFQNFYSILPVQQNTIEIHKFPKYFQITLLTADFKLHFSLLIPNHTFDC